MANRKPSYLGLLLVAALGIVTLALAFPYLASAYHVEAAGRATADPMRAQDHLQRALAWEPNNAQAYRLLGRALEAQGNWPAAVEALTRYAELRPANPLGHMELAQAYEALLEGASAEETGDLDARSAEEWRRAGVTVEELLAQGEAARKAKLYDEAMVWYQRAMRLEPEMGDPWYYMGLLLGKQQQWSLALDAYQQAITLNHLRQVSASDPYCQLAIIYHWHQKPPRTEEALTALETALAIDSFHSVRSAAHCHYVYGYILRGRNTPPQDWIAQFQLATELDPNHLWAHILLGIALYKYDNDVANAEIYLKRAWEIAPDSSAPPYHLGEIYRQEGRTHEAIAMYEKALDADPAFAAARERLETLRGQE